MLDEAIALGSERIKLKTGSGDLGWDENCMRFAGARHVLLGLDSNEGWTPEEAHKILSRPACHGIAFVEQPVSRAFACWDELRSRVRGMKIPPLVADESLQTEGDLSMMFTEVPFSAVGEVGVPPR